MVDDLEIYKILLQRHFNDDRLMGERSSIFIASSSILFAGFAILQPTTGILRIILCCLGIILSIIAIIANRRTTRGLDFWEENERRIETNSQEFTYMREQNMMPHLVYKKITRSIRNRHIYTYILPSVFIILWISSLVWVLVN